MVIYSHLYQVNTITSNTVKHCQLITVDRKIMVCTFLGWCTLHFCHMYAVLRKTGRFLSNGQRQWQLFVVIYINNLHKTKNVIGLWCYSNLQRAVIGLQKTPKFAQNFSIFLWTCMKMYTLNFSITSEVWWINHEI